MSGPTRDDMCVKETDTEEGGGGRGYLHMYMNTLIHSLQFYTTTHTHTQTHLETAVYDATDATKKGPSCFLLVADDVARVTIGRRLASSGGSTGSSIRSRASSLLLALLYYGETPHFDCTPFISCGIRLKRLYGGGIKFYE